MTILSSSGSILASSTAILSSGFDGGLIMALASGTRVSLSYQLEPTTQGVPDPTPDMLELRATGRNINPQVNTLRSQEVRSDRQIASLRHGFNQIVGSPGFELSLEAYDDMIEAAMSGTWAAVASGVLTLDITGSSGDSAVFTSDVDLYTLGFSDGDVVDLSGFVATQPRCHLSVIATTGLTGQLTSLDGSSFTDEAGGGNEELDIVGKVVGVGTTLRTFTVERAFNDVAQYQVFNGVAINQMSLNVQPEAIVNGTFDMLGMSFDALAGSPRDATVTDAATNEPFAAFEGTLFEGSTAIAVVTGLSLSLNNNRSLNAVVGSKFSPAVFEGTATITGELTAYFEDATLLNKFANETLTKLVMRLDDINGTDFMNIIIPSLKYTGGDMDPPQQGPVPLRMPFEAQVDPDTSTSLRIQRSNV